jgi:NAD(P)-dependent dehydrogenase (short-subunit alcohol dehydrogenase family)
MLKDPRSAGPRPPFPKQQQSPPGETGKLTPADGIRVNAVAPGPVWTPLIPSTMSADKAANFGADCPLGRPGQPAEIAPAYVFLASNDASYISGAVLPVSGGKPFL